MDRLTPQQVADKVFELTEQFNHYVFEIPTFWITSPIKPPWFSWTPTILSSTVPTWSWPAPRRARPIPR